MGMGMNYELGDLVAQNGDARRAAEDDILIDLDELLDDGPSNGALPLLHEFEEAWGNRNGPNGNGINRQSRYPASPEPSESESGRRARARSF